MKRKSKPSEREVFASLREAERTHRHGGASSGGENQAGAKSMAREAVIARNPQSEGRRRVAGGKGSGGRRRVAFARVIARR